ncbi:MAG TPA: hypothetical protein VNA19_17515 [Pyrinomonadaceae bacterium]|nr:hypothetical protein [Pyrinomonadaceae bacterium]
MKETDSNHPFLAALLRMALLLSLVGAGWNIHQRLPDDGVSPLNPAARTSPTRLRIILRRAATGNNAAFRQTTFQLFPIDMAAAQQAAQREFLSEPPRGSRLEDFMTRRMGGRAPIAGQLDERGQATIEVPSGKWWVHTTLDGAPELSWRLPVNVAGREQTVELTPDNVYTRTKRF